MFLWRCKWIDTHSKQLTFHIIYNDSKWNLEAVIWRVIFLKKPENFGESPWKKLLEEIYLLVSKSVGCRQIWHTLHPAWWVGEEGLKISGKYLLGSQTYLFWCWCWWGGVVISSLPSLLPFPTPTHHLKISNCLIICFVTES